MDIDILTRPAIPYDLLGINPRLLRPSWWMGEKAMVRDGFNGKCAVCEGIGEECHETYTYDFPYATYAGAVLLCNTCHEFVHLDIHYHRWLHKGIGSAADLGILAERGLRMCLEAGQYPNLSILTTIRSLARIGALKDQRLLDLVLEIRFPPIVPYTHQVGHVWGFIFQGEVIEGGMARKIDWVSRAKGRSVKFKDYDYTKGVWK